MFGDDEFFSSNQAAGEMAGAGGETISTPAEMLFSNAITTDKNIGLFGSSSTQVPRVFQRL
jgi:hypothetical protein